MPAAPNAASEKGEPDVQNSINVPDLKVVPNMQTSIDVPDVKVVPNVQDVPNMQESIEVPDVKAVPGVQDVPAVLRTAAHHIFNTKSPKDGQNNSWQTSPRPRTSPCLPPPRERGSRGHN
jgi:hypothetical protein